MSRAPGAHPDKLLWYAGGSLDPKEAELVDAHLAACRRCREEVALFRSMARSLREQARIDHAGPGELIARLEAGPESGGPRARFLDEHLAACRECASDLETLREARAVEEGLAGRVSPPAATAAAGGAPRRSRAVRLAGFAAALLVLAGLGAVGIARLAPPATVEETIPLVTLVPPERGAPHEVRLFRPGPWKLRVVLPFGHERGRYRASLWGPGLGASGAAAGEVVAGESGVTILTITRDLGPGRFHLMLDPGGDGPSHGYDYPFEVAEEP